jgi:hypothetical protein
MIVIGMSKNKNDKFFILWEDQLEIKFSSKNFMRKAENQNF